MADNENNFRINIDISEAEKTLSQLEGDIDSIGKSIQVVEIPVDVDNSQSLLSINELKTDIESIQSEVSINIDTDDAIKEIDGLKADISSIPEINLSANTDDALSSIRDVQNALLNSENVSQRIDILVNSGDAIKSLSDFNRIGNIIKGTSKEVSKSSDEYSKLSKLVIDLNSKFKDFGFTLDNLPDATPEIDANKLNVNLKSISDITKALHGIPDEKKLELLTNFQEQASGLRELNNVSKLLTDTLSNLDEGSVEFEQTSQQIGQIKDKIGDLRGTINSLSNSPIGNVSKGFGDLARSLITLDFDGVNDGAKNLSLSLNKVDFKSFSSGIGEMGKSFLNLGKSLLSNPIGLFAGAIGLLITNFDKVIEIVKKVLAQFKILGDAVDFVVDLFYSITDAAGLTNKAYDDMVKKSDLATKNLIESNNKIIDAYANQSDAIRNLSGEEQEAIIKKLGLNIEVINSEKQVHDITDQLLNQELENINNNIEFKELASKKEKELNTVYGSALYERIKLTDEENKKYEEYSSQRVEIQNKILSNDSDFRNKMKSIQDNTLSNIDQLTIELASTPLKALQEREKQTLDALQETKDKLIKNGEDTTNIDKNITLQKAAFSKQRSDILKTEADKAKSEMDKVKEYIKNAYSSDNTSVDNQLANEVDKFNELIKIVGSNEKKKNDLIAAYNKVRLDIIIKDGEKFIQEQKKIEDEISTGTRKTYDEQRSDELKSIDRKYDDRISEAKKNSEELRKIVEATESEIARLESSGEDSTQARSTLDTYRNAYSASLDSEVKLKAKAEEEKDLIVKKYNNAERKLILETSLLRAQNDMAENVVQSLDIQVRLANLKDIYDQQRNLRIEAMRQEIEDANGNELLISKIKEKYRSEDIQAEKEYNDTILELKNEVYDKITNITNSIAALNASLGQFGDTDFTSITNGLNNISNVALEGIRNIQNLIDAGVDTKELVSSGGQAVMEVASIIGSVLDEINQRKLEDIQIQYESEINSNDSARDNELSNLKTQLDAKLITEQAYKDGVSGINAKFDQKQKDLEAKRVKAEKEARKKAFNQDKAIKIVTAIAATAVGVTSALSAGPIAGPILAAISGAIGAAQIAIIAAQKFPEGDDSGSVGSGSSGSFSMPPIPDSTNQPQSFDTQDFVGIGQTGQPSQQQVQPIIIENNISANEISEVQENVENTQARANIIR